MAVLVSIVNGGGRLGWEWILPLENADRDTDTMGI